MREARSASVLHHQRALADLTQFGCSKGDGGEGSVVWGESTQKWVRDLFDKQQLIVDFTLQRLHQLFIDMGHNSEPSPAASDMLVLPAVTKVLKDCEAALSESLEATTLEIPGHIAHDYITLSSYSSSSYTLTHPSYTSHQYSNAQVGEPEEMEGTRKFGHPQKLSSAWQDRLSDLNLITGETLTSSLKFHIDPLVSQRGDSYM